MWLSRHERPYMGLYDKLQNLFPINGNSFHRKPKLTVTPCIVLCLYLTQYSSQNKLQSTDLEPCWRLVINLSPS